MLKKIQKYTQKPWYVLLIAGLLAIDHFVLVLPADLLAISAMLVKRKEIWLKAFILAVGSSLGVLLMVVLVQANFHFDFHSSWIENFFKQYGLGTIFILGTLPVPQQPAAILAALSGVSSFKIFLMCFIGRLLKFEFYAYLILRTIKS